MPAPQKINFSCGMGRKARPLGAIAQGISEKKDITLTAFKSTGDASQRRNLRPKTKTAKLSY
jgi:hypothetical protein